uniref:DUF4124 domain-containing protein n=1 Tax=uncultured Acidovorax sp. TaxID=158751 RepID=UPI0009E82FB6|nr:DUF4124 domain-containing protein [uncultured Acidovorax sp.]
MFSLGKKKYKGIMKKYLHSIFLVAAFSACVSAYAQQLYRWKDQNGLAHVSDQPPPHSCTSNDCRSLRDESDRKIRLEKEEAERKKKEAQAAKERTKKFYEELEAKNVVNLANSKMKLKRCFSNGGCSFELISREMKYVASQEGQSGIREVAGQPNKRQVIGESGREYWYYHFAGSSLQLVWSSPMLLMNVNLY